jgi:hypothetical protein
MNGLTALSESLQALDGSSPQTKPEWAPPSPTFGTRQIAFDGKVAAMEEALRWYETSRYRHMTIHSDSTSAIARAGQSGAGPGQERSRKIQQMVARQTAEIA